jgi:hypothetical protein
MTYATMIERHRQRMRAGRSALFALFAAVAVGLASITYATSAAIHTAKALGQQVVAIPSNR